MKYTLAAVGLVFLTAWTPNAAHAQASLSNSPQAAAARNFRSNGAENSGFGIKGGVNINNIVGDGASKYEGRESFVSFHAGVYAQIGISNRFSVQPEVLYQRRGFKSTSLSAAGSEAQSVKLNYVSVPFLLTFNVFDNVALQVGPQASYLFSINQGGEQIAADTYRYNSFDYGAVGGIEAKLEFFRIGARYDYSLRDLRKTGDFSLNGITQKVEGDIRNGSFQVYLGVGL